MTAEQNKALIRRLVSEAVNPRNLDALQEVATGEFAVAARRWVAPFRDAFPDFTMQIADLVADSDTVAAHFRCSGTHLGNGWVIRRPAGASPISTKSTSSEYATGSWRTRSG
jgi:predicted ester cyclase